MRVVVVGSGAREHALAHALARTADVVVTPGNPGIPRTSRNGHEVTITSSPPEHLDADLFVIGPEVPLVDGLADRLREMGRMVFGPGADGAQIEGSKAFMKELVTAAGVPTARYGTFTEPGPAIDFLDTLDGRFVIKTDGLAAGKGVLVTSDRTAAETDIREKLTGVSFGEAGARIVIEETLDGPEISLLVLTDGQRTLPLPAAQDFKRLGDDDTGPNTGGMGAYAPVPEADDDLVDETIAKIVEPTLSELRRRGIEYRGVLYAGLVLTTEGPKLIEYNVRFGDPEAEVVLPLIENDLAELFLEVARGELRSPLVVSGDAAVCVVASAPGYPTLPRVGQVITGIDRAGTVEGVTVFHAGTRRDDSGEIVVSGGRVLVTTAVAPDLAGARDRAYAAMSAIAFEGAHYRRDIARAAAGLSGGGAQ